MKSVRPFDISLTDREATQRARRKRLYKFAAIPCALVILLAVWLALPYFMTAIAVSYYQNGEYAMSKSFLGFLGANDVFERYKRPYNQALTLTQLKQYDTVDDLYVSAIALAPSNKRCTIFVDYMLSVERRGDVRMQANKLPEAIVDYAKAITTIGGQAACFKHLPQIEQRIRDKLQSANDALARQQSRYKTETPAEQKKNTAPPSNSDQAKLQQIEIEGRRKYRTDVMYSQRPQGGSYDGQKW